MTALCTIEANQKGSNVAPYGATMDQSGHGQERDASGIGVILVVGDGPSTVEAGFGNDPETDARKSLCVVRIQIACNVNCVRTDAETFRA